MSRSEYAKAKASPKSHTLTLMPGRLGRLDITCSCETWPLRFTFVDDSGPGRAEAREQHREHLVAVGIQR